MSLPPPGKKLTVEEALKSVDFSWMKPRPPERIERLMALLEEYWKLNPDLRLGQMVCGLGYKANDHYSGLWAMEDTDWERVLTRSIEQIKSSRPEKVLPEE